jgi:hypothetical protein
VRRWKGVHSHRESEPIEEVRERIEYLEFPHGQKRRAAKKDAESGIHEERTHADEKCLSEIIRLLVNYITRRIAQSEIANIEDGYPLNAAEQLMRGFVNNDTRESEQSDKKSGNEEH